MKLIAVAALFVLNVGSTVCASPDEQKLGKDLGYPVGNAARRSWLDDESMRVGSFTHQAEIPGFYNGKPNVLPGRQADAAPHCGERARLSVGH
jgi:hypothetical protein